jgi:hypothetical protein
VVRAHPTVPAQHILRCTAVLLPALSLQPSPTGIANLRGFGGMFSRNPSRLKAAALLQLLACGCKRWPDGAPPRKARDRAQLPLVIISTC